VVDFGDLEFHSTAVLHSPPEWAQRASGNGAKVWDVFATLSAALDLVFPCRCVGCGAAAALLCDSCQPHEPTIRVRQPGLVVAAAGRYEAGLRAALVAYKERGRRDLAGPLAELLAAAVADLDIAPPLRLIGVPSARAVARARGGDHVARLASAAARRCGAGMVPALRQVRAVRDSAALGRVERRSNVAGSMRATPPPLAGTHAVLVDDIVTTGSTLQEAARALCAAGWQVSGAAVVAATM
jgi:predicted amidophosphoribosyltransferase